MAISLCRLGRYHDALPHFAFVMDDAKSIKLTEYHADALRALGRVDEAVALRESLLWDARAPYGMKPRILAGIIDDFRSVGDIYHAFQYADRLMAEHPNAALSYALMAELYLDIGDQNQAFFYIWRGRYKTHLARTEQAYARWLLHKGFPVAAEQYLKARFEHNVSNHALALYAQAKLQAYGPKKALALLDRNKFLSNCSMPVLLIRYRSYRALGNLAKMQEVKEELARIYSDHPLLETALSD